LAFFGKLAYPGLAVMDLIGREHMRESKFFEEVMEEGRIERSRTAILDALEVRFGPEAAVEFAEAVKEIRDPKLLAELHRHAITSRRLTAFRRKLAAGLA